MLDYIKQQLAQQQQHIQEHAVTVSEASEEQMDNAILEYAHLFDDMDDLTMEGANELRERPILDIPLEDDIELDSIEMSLTSNRVMDIPADIAAMEGAYSEQKSYNDFYQEAYKTVTKLPRESEAHFVERVKDVAEGHYNTYMEYVIQEGLFGNDMMNMDDDRVQKNVMLNFGPYKTNTYMTKVPVEYETDNKHRVNVQQVRSLPIAESYNVFESIGEVLKTKLFNEQSIDCEEVWDVATPSRIIVPKFNGDYRCIVEFDIEDGKTTYVEWSLPEAYIRKNENIVESVVERPNHEIKRSDIIGLQLESKDDYIEETYVPRTPRIPSRWVQEAIDFGGGDNADAPPAGDNNATNDAPPAGDDATPDMGNDQADAPTVDAGGDENAKPAAVNDVSDAVASKVSNEANKNTADLGMDGPPTFDSNPDVQLDLDGNGGDAGTGEDVNNLEPDMSGDTSNDMGATDNFDTPTVDDSANVDDPNMTDVNNELGGDVGNDTDMNGDMGEDLGGGSMDNIDDMSIDDLLAKGEEKLKGMSIGQLKDFLNDGLGSDEPMTEAAVDLKTEIKSRVSNCLGILNNTDMKIEQLVSSFKTEGATLNKKLTQASNAKDIDDSQKQAYNQCNKALVNLQMKLKPHPSENEKAKLKEAIIGFCKSAEKIK